MLRPTTTEPTLASMGFIIFVLATMATPAAAITGHAPPASGPFARRIVMLVDDGENLCTATALTRDVVLTAAHCIIGARKRSVKIYQTGETITVRGALPHPQFNPKAYVAARATADLALVKLDKLLPEIVTAAELSPGRPIAIGETLTVAGFGVVKAYTPYGLGIP